MRCQYISILWFSFLYLFLILSLKIIIYAQPGVHYRRSSTFLRLSPSLTLRFLHNMNDAFASLVEQDGSLIHSLAALAYESIHHLGRRTSFLLQ
jgi:hypothetical protein